MLSLVIAIQVDALLEVKWKVVIYVASLTFIAVSRGLVIANIVPFGAEQLTTQTSNNLWSYFLW
jgi:Na+/H+-dicarboxylate symporter